MQPCTRGRTASAPYRTSPGRRNGTPSAHNTSPPLHHLPLLPTLWLTIPPESWACCRTDICWRCSTWTRRRNIPTCRKTLFQRRNMICKGADTPDTATACCSKWRTRTWTGRRDYCSRCNKEAGAEPCTPFFFFLPKASPWSSLSGRRRRKPRHVDCRGSSPNHRKKNGFAKNLDFVPLCS